MGRFLLCLIITLSVLLTPKIINAQASSDKQFSVNANVIYELDLEGTTKVTHEVTIVNLTSEFYAKNYVLTLDNINPSNISAFQGSDKLDTSLKKQGTSSVITIDFKDSVIGRGARRLFTISFEEKSFVTRTGEVWEITIPRLSSINTFQEYNVTLIVPKSFGQEAYFSPEPKSFEQTGSLRKYLFDKESIASVGISAGFGEFQVFTFTLKYHLENPLIKKAFVEIAIPPDTNYQKMYYDRIDPKPNKLQVDSDGNWIATYELTQRERIDVTAQGSVQIFSTPSKDIKSSSENLNNYLSPTKYWQSDEPKIVELSKIYRTPNEIYNYVVRYLSYDYERVKPNVDRLGAQGALNSPKSAICMEFTDLFIAMARAAGIPAREINGFAYTENPEIEPLSLVADVLHAWPEYWDLEKNIWTAVDPTWGSTTGGVDFFNKLDLRHFSFVIHGMDSERPYPAGSYKLGANPEKDVFVSFGKFSKDKTSHPTIEAQVINTPFIAPKVVLKVKNSGPQAIYNTPLDIYYDNLQAKNEIVQNLLPFSTYQEELSIPSGFLALNEPQKIQVYYGSSTLDIPTGKLEAIVYNLIGITFIIAVIVILILVRLKKLKLPDVRKIKTTPFDQGTN